MARPRNKGGPDPRSEHERHCLKLTGLGPGHTSQSPAPFSSSPSRSRHPVGAGPGNPPNWSSWPAPAVAGRPRSLVTSASTRGRFPRTSTARSCAGVQLTCGAGAATNGARARRLAARCWTRSTSSSAGEEPLCPAASGPRRAWWATQGQVPSRVSRARTAEARSGLAGRRRGCGRVRRRPDWRLTCGAVGGPSGALMDHVGDGVTFWGSARPVGARSQDALVRLAEGAPPTASRRAAAARDPHHQRPPQSRSAGDRAPAPAPASTELASAAGSPGHPQEVLGDLRGPVGELVVGLGGGAGASVPNRCGLRLGAQACYPRPPYASCVRRRSDRRRRGSCSSASRRNRSPELEGTGDIFGGQDYVVVAARGGWRPCPLGACRIARAPSRAPPTRAYRETVLFPAGEPRMRSGINGGKAIQVVVRVHLGAPCVSGVTPEWRRVERIVTAGVLSLVEK